MTGNYAKLTIRYKDRDVNVTVWYDAHVSRFYARTPGNGGAAPSANTAIADALFAWAGQDFPPVSHEYIPEGWKLVSLWNVIQEGWRDHFGAQADYSQCGAFL